MVSARRSGSPQKSEGRPIEEESDAEMEPTLEDKTFQSDTILGAEAELVPTTAPTNEMEVEPEASPPTEAQSPSLE